MARADLPIAHFADAAAWEAWLAEHHADSPGLRLQIAKKGGGATSVSYAEALDAALCHGWIDSQKGRYDDRFYLQRFTPRAPRSPWSQVNREHVARLVAVGRMRPAGLAEVDRAKADGRWDRAYAPQSTATVPYDLRAALDADPVARATFERLTGSQRYAVLYRLQDAKRPETRARRLATVVTALAGGRVPYA